MLKTVSILYGNSELVKHFIQWGSFLICSGNNNILFLMYACEVMHLINKALTTPYVQVKGGIL